MQLPVLFAVENVQLLPLCVEGLLGQHAQARLIQRRNRPAAAAGKQPLGELFKTQYLQL